MRWGCSPIAPPYLPPMLLLLMEFKFLIMITRPQNITVATLLAGNSNVLWSGHHYQKFKFHQQQEALAAHFDFTSFSVQPFLDSWLQLFLHLSVLVGIMITVQTSNLSIVYINITDHKLAKKFLNSLIVLSLITSVGNVFHSFTAVGKKEYL